MIDTYNDFGELSAYHHEEVDYRIHRRKVDSRYAIMAIHGGTIERGTMKIADLIAADDHAYYCFEGIHNPSRHLHITSNRFNEPRALEVARSVDTVITVHGAYGQAREVYLGGLDEELKSRFIEALLSAGFAARPDPSPTRQGRGKSNICNRGRSGRGVQLELPRGLRKSLFIKPAFRNNAWQPGERLQDFVAAIRDALD